MTTFIAALVLAAMIIAVYETGAIMEGGMTGDANAEFLSLSTLVLATLALIPLALRLFRFKAVAEYIARHRERGHYRMAMLRMAMLCVPLLANLMCYYLFMRVGFAYLALILAISLFFIVPTKDRCASEL